jgi:hypothetical protein
MTIQASDPNSITGKPLAIDETVNVLVVGAGAAGLEVAIGARAREHGVLLVDENLVPFKAMGEDVPPHFGQAFILLSAARFARSARRSRTVD